MYKTTRPNPRATESKKRRRRLEKGTSQGGALAPPRQRPGPKNRRPDRTWPACCAHSEEQQPLVATTASSRSGQSLTIRPSLAQRSRNKNRRPALCAGNDINHDHLANPALRAGRDTPMLASPGKARFVQRLLPDEGQLRHPGHMQQTDSRPRCGNRYVTRCLSITNAAASE